MTNTIENTTSNSTRVPYGFSLKFPQTFTLRDLRKQKSHKVKYITLYMRVKKALANGEIEITGKKIPATKRRGKRENIYSVINAKNVEVTTQAVQTQPSIF